ncbi:MAG: restriction endonuclease subunit S [Candidatus Pararuminococcus gallinarum]|jgi:type I restriction enzyme S subunit
MNETKKPAVRFKGFSVEWERHPMDELTTELHEYATLDSLYPLLTSSREGIMFQNEYRSNRTTENNKTLFSIVPYGKCTYRHMSDDDIFHFNINDIVENGLVSREYPVFDSTDDNELRFIVALLNSSEQFRKFCRERKIGGTRTRLYYKDLSNFKPLCPEFDEQRNIAEFLDDITSIISYHQSKLEKLQSLKASMLEKMFPKNGSDVPEIRFKGFDEKWSTIELAQIADKVNEKNVQNYITETFTNSAEHGIISQRDFFDHDISKAEKINGYYIVEDNDFVYNPRVSVTAPCGPINCNRLGRTGVMSPLYTVFRTHDIDTLFLEWYFKSSHWYAYMRFNGDSGARSDRFSIKSDLFFKMPIPIPSMEEQHKIGQALQTLNENINLNLQELDKLQSIKKALLEKMFV